VNENGITRISVSINPRLLKDIEDLCRAFGTHSRSEIIREAIRVFVNKHRDTQRTARMLDVLQENCEIICIVQLKKFKAVSLDLSMIHAKFSAKLDGGLFIETVILRGRAGKVKKELENMFKLHGILQPEIVAIIGVT
jgi:metal-responsive CopG/Arc/MetJ family transcriptional regulator